MSMQLLVKEGYDHGDRYNARKWVLPKQRRMRSFSWTWGKLWNVRRRKYSLNICLRTNPAVSLTNFETLVQDDY